MTHAWFCSSQTGDATKCHICRDAPEPKDWTRHVDPRDRSPREANWPSFERGQPPLFQRY